MATFEFTCQKCEGAFEIEVMDLIDGSEALECPHCNARLSKSAAEDFTAALAEFNAQVAAISKKFTLSVEFDSETIPAAEDDDDDDDDDDGDDDDDDDDDDDNDDLDDDDLVEEDEDR